MRIKKKNELEEQLTNIEADILSEIPGGTIETVSQQMQELETQMQELSAEIKPLALSRAKITFGIATADNKNYAKYINYYAGEAK